MVLMRSKSAMAGNTIPIAHFGTASFSTSYGTFYLNNLYHIPSISTNLLYISQFSKENDCFFEFHPNLFVVKSSQGIILLHIWNENGLYRFECAREKNSLMSYSSFLSKSVSLWHQRLGHLTFRTVNKVIEPSLLPIINKVIYYFQSCH